MQADDITDRTRALTELMETHLGTRSKTLRGAVRKAGRRLPRGLRAKARLLIEAEDLAAHPKLMRRIDFETFEAAYRDLAAHLTAIDRAEERRTRALNIAAGLAFNLLLLAVLLLVFLRWRGFL